MANLRRALPEAEYEAVAAWLTTFFPFQQEWLLDWARFSLIVKARQIGISHTSAAAAVLWSMLGDTSLIISVGEREAADMLEYSARHAKALEALGSKWASPRSATKTVLRLSSGGRVVALPATSGGRGYAGNVILDEFAYHDRPDAVWDGAAGAVTHGFKLRVVSTPNGVGNLFHRLWTSPKQHKGYSLHRVTIDEARTQGMRINDEQCWAAAHGDVRVYDQMYRCSFLDNLQQYIPSKLIEAATVESTYSDGECYAGLDIGRTVDLTVLVIVRVDEHGVRWVAHVETCKRTAYADLEQFVATAVRTWRCRRVCVDATGMGAFPTEQLQAKFGKQRVEGVTFTQQVKEDLATTMYQHFADQRIRIPAPDRQLSEDIASIRRIVTSAGNVRYDAPHTDEGHADRAWALALALHGCSGPDRRRHEVHDHNEPPTGWT